MGNLIKKVVATVIAITMVMTSGLFVFAEDSPSGGSTPEETTKPAQVKLTNSKGSVSKKQIVVNWKKVEGADYYKVYVNGKLKVKKVTGTTTTLKKLKTGKTYNIKIVAVKGKEEGKASAVKKMTLSKRWLKSVKITAKGKKGKATISWKKVKDATGYQIKYSKDGKTWKTKNIKSDKKLKTTLKLDKGKWQVRVRPVKGKAYLGVLCKAKTVKVK